MQDDRRAEWTPEERELLDRLPRDRQPPSQLEERVVAELRCRGMIRDTPAWKGLAAIAASLVVLVPAAFIIGVQFGASGAGSVVGSDATFALMVLDPAAGNKPVEQADAAKAEATKWAEELAAAGILVAAEKLRGRTIRLVPRDGEGLLKADFPSIGEELVLGGFFLIRASGYEEARRIAAESPLLRYGSIIEVRGFERIPE